MSAPTLKLFYRNLINSLSDLGSNAPDQEARFMLHKRADLSLDDIVMQPDLEVETHIVSLIHSDLELRRAGKPLSKIYQCGHFWGRDFKVTEDTLDPRNDTETLMSRALELFPKDKEIKILDLGTGTGCILLTLLLEYPNATGVAVDISDQAIAVAKENAQEYDVQSRSKFLQGSWFEPLGDEKFDLIVSNPPYISNLVIPNLAPEVKNHDPILALDGGADGLQAYKNIFLQIKNFLKPGGIALLEIGYDQKDDVMRLSENSGFAQRIVHMDMATNPRVVEISCGDK